MLLADIIDGKVRKLLINTSFTVNEIQTLQKLIQILEIFDEITKEISAEHFVTCSKILVFIRILNLKFNNFNKDRDFYLIMLEVLKALEKEFNERFLTYESNELICQVTFLDARFKKLGIRNEQKYFETATIIKNKLTNASRNEEIDNPIENQNKTASNGNKMFLGYPE